MKYAILLFTRLDHTQGINVLRINGDEIVTLGQGEQDPDYLAWVAEGNVAEEWQPEEPVTENAN